MEYTIVTLEEKKVVGVSARTNNASPDMGMVIGGLWQSFFGDGIYASIDNKVNGKTLGIYTDYAGDEKDDYTAVVACESDAVQVPDGASVSTIPAGKYARFIVKGEQQRAVAEFWTNLWQMELPRAFVCDFEEYQSAEMEQAEIHMYIGLKD